MHILLTNDDGPLDDQTCPYIKYLVDEINTTTDWDLLIVVPDQQRLWIGKAHFAGKTVAASYIYTQTLTETKNDHINDKVGPFDTPQKQYRDDASWQEWCLINSTPAACADIGIHHLYAQSKGKPVDLVISGPNFGKNSGNLYIMTSGTVGAAMEAVTHGVKAIAVSYAFFKPEHKYEELKQAAKITVKLVHKLYQQLQKRDDVDIFTVNVPLLPLLEYGTTKVHYAPILENYWNSIYEPVATGDDTAQFKWAPDFTKVHRDGLLDKTHTDSRVLLDEGVSVTPLKAAFHPVQPLTGEISLDDEDIPAACKTLRELTFEEDVTKLTSPTLLITFPKSSYIFDPITHGFSEFDITTNIDAIGKVKLFHYGEYEDLDLDHIRDPEYYLCSYIYRKALIRKHYLANTVHHYVTKNPGLILKRAVPELFQIEVDYAEFLEEALDDAYELREEIELGTKLWILKPSMSDKAQGIRVFRTIDQLQEIFDSFDEDDTDDEGDENDTGVIISQLRHFIVQQYLERPLLLANYDNKKFHLRVYVVAQGDLNVYVYRNILTLFAGTPYQPPTDLLEMEGHLTNTCLQEGESPLVVPFWNLHDPNNLNQPQKQKVFNQVCEITGELFKAAVSVDKMNFQPLPNAMEVFGIDFLVNHDYTVSLLEVNLYPDFKQTGDDLKGLIDELFSNVGDVAYELVTGAPMPKLGLVQVYP